MRTAFHSRGIGPELVPYWMLMATCLCVPRASGQVPTASERLQYVQTVTGDDLTAVCNVNFGPDGKCLYAAAWQAAAIAVFEPDPGSGELRRWQSITDSADLNGVTTIRFSSDGRFAVAAAFRSRTVVLFERDAFSGKLTILDIVRGAERPELGLAWPIDAVFSPNGRFVYVCDPKQSGAVANQPQQGSIVVFEVTRRGKLELVEVNHGQDKCFWGCRGIAFHPGGRTGYAACANANQVVVVDRDPKTGKISVRQVIKDDRDAPALEGAIALVCSPDGRFVYVSSGRFSGDDSVTLFRVEEDGSLVLEQTLTREVELTGFAGGNELTLSPDGRRLYVTATRSSSLAALDRHPETGRLTVREILHNGRTPAELAGAADVAVSTDGRFVYVAAEGGKAISVLSAGSSPTLEPAPLAGRQTAEP